MNGYKRIILAVELIPEADEFLVKKAVDFAKEFNATITLVHAIEHMSSYGAAYGVAVGADIEEILIQNAQDSMTKLGEQIGVSKEHQLIKMGPAGVIILEEADNVNADLILVGSHGRHGIRLLLGSTANAVLHGAKCDVLAVRLKD